MWTSREQKDQKLSVRVTKRTRKERNVERWRYARFTPDYGKGCIGCVVVVKVKEEETTRGMHGSFP
jgi:hypothetical protein